MKHLFTLIVTVFTFAAGATNHQVQLGSNFCNPSSLTVSISDTVTWTQVSSAHDVNGSLSTTCADLFFSEYIEGSSNSKALEIYNPTNAAINLATYSVKLYTNGGTTATNTLQLPNKNLAPDDVYVIANSAAIAAILSVDDTTSSVTNFNGDDAVVLFKNTDTLDIIGDVGVDPGVSWVVGTGTTVDYTLVRKATVNKGQRNWVTGANEWDVYPNNTTTYLGGHISNCLGMAWDGSAWSPSTPTLTDNVRFNGNYTVSAGSSFTANNLTVSSGNTLTLEASSSGYAQLKVNGSLVNQGTVIAKQYLTGTGHHSVSSPMSNGFTTTNGTSSALYAYNASTGAYNMSPTLTSAGTGFFAPLETSGFLSSAGTFSATGTPTTSHTHTLLYAQTQVSGGSGSGWNLIGNPYTCGLDWNAVTKTNVNNTYYVWDPTSSKYQYYSASALTGTYLAASSILSGVIAPMQAFWVQASTSSAASIVSTMAASGTVSTSPTFYKTAPDNLILYVEDLSDPSLSDAMWITHATGYTNDFEGDLDAWKLHNYGAKASIFSYHNGDKLAINAIDLSSSASVPVGVKAPEVGKKYQLVLEQVVNNQDYQVILEDRLFNSFTDITGQGYGFTHSAWQNEDPRFVVHINQSTVGMGESSASTVKAYQQGERLILQGNGQQHGSYAVSAFDGRVIAQGLLQAGMASIVAPQVGVYIVNFIGAAPETQRIVIQ
jgi:hypothetical protein